VFVLDPVAVVDADPVDFVRQGARLCPILVLAGDAGIGFVAAGAAGVIDRDGASDVLVNAVADVAGQVRVISPRTSVESDTYPELSPREHEVLAQIADGLTHGQIARKLGISSHTVDTYVKRIRSKIGVGNKADLTRAALLGRF
jgi:DNA-binding NarL/FixJ family response regulator